MAGLIMVIISIALLSGFMAATLHYIPAETLQKERNLKLLMASLAGYQEGVGRYLVAQKVRIPPAAPNEASPGYYIPWIGAGVDLRASVVPAYLFEPQALQGMEWEVTTTLVSGYLPGVSVCLKPKAGIGLSAVERSLLQMAKERFSAGSVVVGSACGDDASGGDHLTLRMLLSHYE